VNLLEDGSLTGIGIINADPNLSVLQDNGGLRVGASDNEQPLLTQVPLEGSPAINAGNNDFLSESALEVDFNGDGDTSDNLNTDQRGDRFDRVVNDTVDLGALEVQAGGENGNEPPVANNDTVNTDENTVVNGNVLADNSNGADNDPDEDTLTITVVNGNSGNVGEAITLDSGASLTLNQDGTFSYNPRRQFENLNIDDTATETFSYTISDSNGGTDSATVEIIIEGINDAPEIPVISSLVLDENTSTVVTIEADDPEQDPLSFSLSGGADQALFSINATTGELSFTETPDFENPADADGDNIYEVEFTVEDGNGETTSRNLEVTIENVNEPPLFGDNPIFTVNPEQPEEFSGTVAATDPEGAGVNFRITEGNETGAFAINNEGVITVADAAELPEQGIFNLSVEATDTSEEQLSSTADVTINVTAGNLDIGGNGEVDQSDALLLQAQLFGTPGLIQAVSEDFNRSAPGTVTRSPDEIEQLIQDNSTVFEISGNGEMEQSDALLLQAQLFGTSGLIQAVSDDFNRAAPGTVTRTPEEIEQLIEAISPSA
jgi:hypothetical protein